MSVKAYVLIEVEVGKTSSVIDNVQKLEGVKFIDSVTGPYDVIVTVEVADLEALGNLIRQIHAVAGICKTTTHIAVKF